MIDRVYQYVPRILSLTVYVYGHGNEMQDAARALYEELPPRCDDSPSFEAMRTVVLFPYLAMTEH